MSKPLRSIQLDLPEDPAEVIEDFYTRDSIETKHGTVTTERWKANGLFHTRTVTDEAIPRDFGHEVRHTVEDSCVPARIKFETIKAKAEITFDDHMGATWEDCDGYEHELLHHRDFNGPEDAFPLARGYSMGIGKIVTVTDKSFCGDSFKDRYERLRKQGASKQVAREVIASQDREYIDYIVEEYNRGHPDTWWVRIEIEINDETYENSLGGIYGEDYARGECLDDVADEVAHMMEKDGWEIVGRPDRKASYRASRLYHMKQKLNMFNWRS